MGLKKELENFNRWWLRNQKTIIILLGLVYILSGDMAFWTGFHNIDYSRNFLKIAYINGLDYDSWGDQNLGGNIVDFDQVYVNGLENMIMGFYIMMIGMLMFGYGLFKSK